MSRRVYKQPRQNRWALIEQQEQLITAKKKEIEEKIKAAQERQSESKKPSESDDNLTKSVPSQPNTAISNKFANDGSFFETFKRLQQQQKTITPNACTNSALESPVSQVKEETNEQEDRNEPNFERAGPSKQDQDKEKEENNIVRIAIEKCAIFITMNGPNAEKDLKSQFEKDPSYAWLYDESDVHHQFFRQRLDELRRAKQRASDEASFSQRFASENLHQETFERGEEPEESDKSNRKPRVSRWDGEKIDAPSQSSTPQDQGLVQYALQVYGSLDLSRDQWKQLEDQRKMKVLFEMIDRKRKRRQNLDKAGKFVYDYDSDEETDGGTWEHKRRNEEMEKTREWAEKLTEMNRGKHHIGDFLPANQLEKFMKKWESLKDGSTSLLYDEAYQDFKLNSENPGYKMLAKLGWTEGQGLGVNEDGIKNPISNEGNTFERAGLGAVRPDDLAPSDDEYDAYRKRMMLAYRFRPNPMNNPRRPYY